jgi:hypothetical protein
MANDGKLEKGVSTIIKQQEDSALKNLELALEDRALENWNYREWAEKNRKLQREELLLHTLGMGMRKMGLDEDDEQLVYGRLALQQQFDELDHEKQELALDSLSDPVQLLQRRILIFSDLLELASNHDQKVIIRDILNDDEQALVMQLVIAKRQYEEKKRNDEHEKQLAEEIKKHAMRHEPQK